MKGVKTAPPRHRHVLGLISGNYGTEPMAQAIGMLFVERAFPPESKARSLELIGNVKAALGDRLASPRVDGRGHLSAPRCRSSTRWW
jgi:predicted metalloendopeptidase